MVHSVIYVWILAALFAWMVVFTMVDTPSTPSWHIRWAYRGLTGLLLIGLTLTSLKAMQWHSELVALVNQCR